MKKLLTLYLAALLALAPLVPAQAVQQPMSAGPFFGGDAAYRIDQQLQKGDQNFAELYGRVGDVPLAYGGWFPGESQAASAANTAEQVTVRKLYYLPGGGVSGRLIISNTAANSSASVGETDPATGVTFNLGIEPNIPGPWNGGSYNAGDQVTFESSQYVALVPNTGIMPGVFSSATWATQATANPKPITVNGSRPASIGLQTTVAGATVPAGYVLTDRFPIGCTKGCWVAIDMFGNQPAGGSGVVNTLYTGPISDPLAGEVAAFGQFEGDYTALAGPPAGPLNSTPAPMLIGIPAISGPTADYFGDSLSSGVQTSGLIYQSGSITGGSGFVANTDQGRTCTLTSTNNAASVVSKDAQAQITTVSGGAITGFFLTRTGSYTSAVSTGPYTFTCPGSAGTGASVASFGIGNAHDSDGPYLTQGYLQRTLADAGVRFGAFAKSGDLLAAYQARDYTRLSVAGVSGASTAIIELGINDVFAGASATTILSRAQALAAQLRGYPNFKRIILMTLPPASTTSSDAFRTPTGQSVNGTFNTVRAAYNALVRAVPAGFDGMLDAAACMEDARYGVDSGIWITDGVTPNLLTADGLHVDGSGMPKVEACLAPKAQALVTSGAIK